MKFAEYTVYQLILDINDLADRAIVTEKWDEKLDTEIGQKLYDIDMMFGDYEKISDEVRDLENILTELYVIFFNNHDGQDDKTKEDEITARKWWAIQKVILIAEDIREYLTDLGGALI